MSPAAQRILDRLDGTRQQWWIFSLLSTGTLAVSLSLAAFVILMLLDAVVRFSQTSLWILCASWLLMVLALAVLVCRRLLGRQRSLVATARCVEREYPELDSQLINLVQLIDDSQNENQAFREAAITVAAEQMANFRFEEAALHESRWRRLRYCMQTPRDFAESLVVFGMILAASVVLHLLLPNWSSAANRLMTPWKFVPSVGQVRITVTPGDADILLGAKFDIVAEINDIAPADSPLKAKLFIAPIGQTVETAIPMTPGEPFDAAPSMGGPAEPRRKYAVTIPSVIEEFTYRVEIGDSQSPRYRVRPRPKPTIEEVEITYHYPPYLARQPQTIVARTPDMEAPQYTRAVLRIRTTAPITSGRLEWEGGGITGQVQDDGRLFVAELVLLRNLTFTARLRGGDNDSGTDDGPRHRIRVLTDAPPVVELLKPTAKSSAAPGDAVAVMLRATDDHGLGRIALEVKVRPTATAASTSETAVADQAAADAFGDNLFSGGDLFGGSTTGTRPNHAADGVSSPATTSENEDDDAPIRTVQTWTESITGTTVVQSYRLELKDDLGRPGHTVFLRAVAWDRRNHTGFGLDLRPQQAVSPWRAIEVNDPQVAVDAKLAELDNLRNALFKLLEKQIRAQVQTGLLSQRKTLDEARILAGAVREAQIDLQKSSIALVRSIGEGDARERLLVKRALNAIAFGDMLRAVEQCDAMAKATDLAALEPNRASLHETQGRIVDALRAMLNVARRARTEELAEMDRRGQSDLPDDAKQKLEAINNALEEALEAQRKVVEASERLAKAPVEDFAEAEEQLAKALAAAEVAWDKFMTEMNTDLGKLPEQDFANPSALKELVEIQTEIKMAEDALLEKTADIAVPLEQLGYEMAEEIKTNMEKWLPDTPDRERWSQEESLTDADKEAPMAELPGELEDLIGELMEEQEDLFDEMEDISSSAADSLDAGAGWDVADGPISNMSAKGATGNRLPNTSEIGGRAGEGRQGKSSGEFVGDEAVGKGGRNTPSRLTPDPFVKGQIKDHSKDPVGGATGGGKESGEGGEGLEGPQPGFRGQRDLGRLAGKQADLRNKAEGIDLAHFQVMGYHQTDLKRMMELMSQVEQDLAAGRYQNALRQRQVLAEGLGNVKAHLEGEYQVRQDLTPSLPTDVQKEILGSMQDPSPPGWDQLNREYFQRLSKGGG